MFTQQGAWERLAKGAFTVAAPEAATANEQAGGLPKALHMANPSSISHFTLDA